MGAVAASLDLSSPPTAVSWLMYVIIGGLAGWAAGKIIRGSGAGILLNIVIGVVGGFLGGILLSLLGVDVVGGRRIFTFFVSLLGAVILLWVAGLIRRR